ncbi:GNAT family N-acetyltransferase [Pseudonocardia sp. GCM10023141]|uniref:GNAT family N-acetyltransferase n=1 Tax=Pseudonocardia sp. GCM10023141 TaxID=3252653 RepID=UPI00360B7DB5
MRTTLTDTAPAPELLADAVALYGAAFGGAPYFETAEQAAGFGEQVQRHARERAGFRFVTVQDGDTLLALAMAVLARPGQWWRDQVAGRLSVADADRWLGPECLEVIEVAVAPAAHGRGLGRLVHDVLISGSPAPTGALICHPEALAAQRLYTSRGWTRIGSMDDGRWLLARDL